MSYSGFHLVNVYLHDFMKQYGRLKMSIETKCRKRIQELMGGRIKPSNTLPLWNIGVYEQNLISEYFLI